MVGYDPRVILEDTLGTELEVLKSIALGLSLGFQDNNRRLIEMATSLRFAGWLLIAAPFIGAAAYGATQLLIHALAAWHHQSP